MYATCDQIIDNLFLGNCQAAQNLNLLKRHRITHVLVAAFGLPKPFPSNFEYKQFRILDFPTENISKYFDTAVRWIDNALKNDGRVFVHCMAGISRSSTMIIAYLIYKGWGYQEAFNYCRSKHRDTFPNFGFQRQLQNYDMRLRRQGHSKQNANSNQQQSSGKKQNESINSLKQEEEEKVQQKQSSPQKYSQVQNTPPKAQPNSQNPIRNNRYGNVVDQSPYSYIGMGNPLVINSQKIHKLRSSSQNRTGPQKISQNGNPKSQENSPLKQGNSSGKNQLAKMKQISNEFQQKENMEIQISTNKNPTQQQENQKSNEKQSYYQKSYFYSNIGKGQPRLTQSYQFPNGSFKGIKKNN